MSKKINLILAMTFDGGIGYKNTIPWNVPREMKKFRSITRRVEDGKKQNAVIMGRKTWDSISKPLPYRSNIIITTKIHDYCDDDIIVIKNIEDALDYCNNKPNIESIYIIGGATLYNELMNTMKYNIDKIYLSVFFEHDIKVDTYINIDVLYQNFKLVKDQDYTKDCENKTFASYICYSK